MRFLAVCKNLSEKMNFDSIVLDSFFYLQLLWTLHNKNFLLMGSLRKNVLGFLLLPALFIDKLIDIVVYREKRAEELDGLHFSLEVEHACFHGEIGNCLHRKMALFVFK